MPVFELCLAERDRIGELRTTLRLRSANRELLKRLGALIAVRRGSPQACWMWGPKRDWLQLEVNEDCCLSIRL